MAKDDAAKAAPRQKMLVFNAWASGERAELGLFVCLWPSCTACTGKAMAPTPVLLPGEPQGRGAWWAAVHGVAKSRTRLSDFTFTFHFHALEKEMATHSSVLAWRIPGTREPGGLPSMGLHRVGHDCSELAAAAALLVDLSSPTRDCTCALSNESAEA